MEKKENKKGAASGKKRLHSELAKELKKKVKKSTLIDIDGEEGSSSDSEEINF
jgi:hypothetical protein